MTTCACIVPEDRLRVYGCTGSGVWRAVRPEVALLSAALLDELARARMYAGRSWGAGVASYDEILAESAVWIPLAALHQ